MGHSNSKITAPVSLHADVYPVLGLQKTGTFYDTGYACGNTHGQTNPWAKYKPTIYNSPDGGSRWWKANDGRCGLTPYLVGSPSLIPQAYKDNPGAMKGWTYSPPVPGRNWCRLTDFNGYNHNATPQYSGFSGMGDVGLSLQSFSFATMMAVPETRTDMVNFEDMNFPAEDMYFGVFIEGEINACATANTPGTTSVTFTTAGFRQGDYTAYPFLGTAKQTQGASYQGGSFYTVPGLEPVDFKVVGSLLTIQCVARKSLTGSDIQYTVSVTSSMGSVTLNNNIIRLRYPDKDLWDTMVIGEKNATIPNVRVDNGTTQIASGVFSDLQQDILDTGVIWVSLSTGQYTGKFQVMQSVDVSF